MEINLYYHEDAPTWSFKKEGAKDSYIFTMPTDVKQIYDEQGTVTCLTEENRKFNVEVCENFVIMSHLTSQGHGEIKIIGKISELVVDS